MATDTNIGVQGVSSMVGLFLSIKIFKIYMLMYGKGPGLEEIIQNLKNT